MKQWFVAQTQPGKESLAQSHLERQGFEPFLPVYKKTIRHARQVKEVLRPLFQGYIFVRLDVSVDQWRSVNGTRGVSYLLTYDDHKPAAVPDTIIDTLKDEQDQQGSVSLGATAAFLKGDAVRITEGAFEDQMAIVARLNDKDRVQLLLTFMNRPMKIELPASSLEKQE